ncbi:MAG: T9SS type A sorting domain-containing protein [Chlorobi bacterium]|nr:T9SS type A sorting domain-containing protein [Chlorobiota bacterium]
MKRKPKTKIMNKLLLSGAPLFLLLIFFTGMSDNGKAQQITPTVVCSGGETLTAASLSLDFTVGEIATGSLSTTGLLLTEGFIQGPDRNTGVQENLIDEKAVVVYPNPVTSGIYILCNDPETGPVSTEIKDLQGRMVLRSDSRSNPMHLNLEKLTPGFYTVSIQFKNHQIINKKIIKQ